MSFQQHRQAEKRGMASVRSTFQHPVRSPSFAQGVGIQVPDGVEFGVVGLDSGQVGLRQLGAGKPMPLKGLPQLGNRGSLEIYAGNLGQAVGLGGHRSRGRRPRHGHAESNYQRHEHAEDSARAARPIGKSSDFAHYPEDLANDARIPARECRTRPLPPRTRTRWATSCGRRERATGRRPQGRPRSLPSLGDQPVRP